MRFGGRPMGMRLPARHLTRIVVIVSGGVVGRGAWVLLCIGLSTTASASDVYKCVSGTGVAYQKAPCSEGQLEASVLRLPDYADPPQRDGAMAPTASPDPAAPPSDAASVRQTAAAPTTVARRGFPFRTTIGLGMTDDQALNTPHWGPPSRITRARERRGWHEAWVYVRGDGVRKLSFTNGTLTGIDAGTRADAALRFASARND